MFHNWISIFLICRKFDLLIDEISNRNVKNIWLKIGKIKKQKRICYASLFSSTKLNINFT
ncbi:hypothetical protein CN300_21950 [Bacillus thuringiensis]|nr:hypothetical protein F8510_21035 [Bacillus sp. RM2(2019)]PEC16873.1 hypothetical protein CON19_10525 [Bacillus thuringiensis]PEV08032.1 hypothetical protein CN418_24820 [Bacillus thuringiensis]PFC42396.1 hypothetical protein CN300_21950 [Bacillus thuringiensis]PGV70028.1 hypothetical protein COD96_11170 [Bacillus thuringiensis]